MSEVVIPAIIIPVVCTLFFFWRLISWRGPRPWLFVLAVPALALCFWYPLLGLLDKAQPWSAVLALCGNVWTVTAGFFLCVSLVIEIVRALAWLYLKSGNGEGRDVLPARRAVPLALGLLLAVTAYAAFEAQNVRAKHIAIQTDKLPAGVNNYRIVFVADIHLNELAGEKFLGRITELIKAQNADLLLLGGDVAAYRDMRGRQKEAAMLAGAMPPNGTLAVLGNHEAMNDHMGNSIPFLKRAWAHVMRGEAIAVGSVFIVGVDDPKVAEMQGSTVHDPMIILNRMPHERFVILLKHRPDIQPESIGLFDLQLSAHTHGGQIWPVSLFMDLFLGSPQGKLTPLEGAGGKSWYYCTVGAGFNMLPLRFLTPPEVVVIDLVR